MDIISTRQVAELLAVSEATVKRWADAGTLRCFRTPGGHRKFRMEDVSTFLREFQYETGGIVAERPALPSSSSASTNDVPASRPPPLEFDRETIVLFRNAALAGDSDALVSLIAQARLRGATLPEIFDGAIHSALADIGDRWARGVLTVSQEHLAAQTVIEALARTKPLIERAGRQRGKVALACLGEEQHDIAIRMASLLAHGAGFGVAMLGARTPVNDFGNMVVAERPRFVVISASAVSDGQRAAADLGVMIEACRSAGAQLLAGGDGYAAHRGLAGMRFVDHMVDLQSALLN